MPDIYMEGGRWAQRQTRGKEVDEKEHWANNSCSIDDAFRNVKYYIAEI